MASRSRAVHIVAFIALTLNLLAPLVTVQATALDQLAALQDMQEREPSTQQTPGNNDAGEEIKTPEEPGAGDLKSGENDEQQSPPVVDDGDEKPTIQGEPENPDDEIEQDDTKTPDDTGDGEDSNESDSGTESGEGGGEDLTDEMQVLEQIAPQDPVITTAVCDDGVTSVVDGVELPSAPAGVTYVYGPGHGGEQIEVRASIDASTHTWDAASFLYEGSKWSLNDDGSASYRDVIAPCPDPVVAPEKSSEKSDGDSAGLMQPSMTEGELPLQIGLTQQCEPWAAEFDISVDGLDGSGVSVFGWVKRSDPTSTASMSVSAPADTEIGLAFTLDDDTTGWPDLPNPVPNVGSGEWLDFAIYGRIEGAKVFYFTTPQDTCGLEEAVPPNIHIATYGSCPGYFHTIWYAWDGMRGMEPRTYQRIYDPFGAAIPHGTSTLYENLASMSLIPGTTINVVHMFKLEPGYAWPASWPEGVQMNGGWGIDVEDPNMAFFVIQLQEQPSCNPVAPELLEPTPGTCSDDPIIHVEPTRATPRGVLSEFDAITYIASDPDENGDYTVTATWQNGFSRPVDFPDPDVHPNWSAPDGDFKTATYSGNVDLGGCPEVEITKSRITSFTNTTPIVDAPVSSGGVLYYEIRVTNTGTENLTGITYGDQVPEGTKLLRYASNPIHESCAPVPAQVPSATGVECTQYELGELEPGQSLWLRLEVEVVESPSAEVCESGIENTAQLTGINEIDEITVDSPLNSESVITDVNCASHTIDKSVVDDGIDMGVSGPDDRIDADDTVTFEITVSNSGNVVLENLEVLDEIKSGTGGIEFGAVTGGEFTENVDGTGGNIAPIPVGDSVTIEVTYTITQADIDSGSIENCASTVTNDQIVGLESCEPVTGLASAGLTVQKDGGEVDMTVAGPTDRVDAGDVLGYTVTVTNSGNTTLTSVDVLDTVKSDGTPNAAVMWQTADFPGNVSLNGNGVPVISELLPGDFVTLSSNYILTQGDLNVGGTIWNCAAAASTDASVPMPGVEELLDSDQCVSTDVEPWQVPSATITKTQIGSDDPVFAEVAAGDRPVDVGVPVTSGDLVAYRVVVTNTGNQDFTFVHVADQVPAGTEYFGSVIGSGGFRCDFPSGSLEGSYAWCNRSSNPPLLANGGTWDSVFIFRVLDDVSPQQCVIENTAVITSIRISPTDFVFDGLNGDDPHILSNPVVTPVDCDPAVDVQKTVDGSAQGDGVPSVGPEEDFSWAISAWNAGAKDPVVDISDPLPEGFVVTDFSSTPADACEHQVDTNTIACDAVELENYSSEESPGFTVTITGYFKEDFSVCGPQSNEASLVGPGGTLTASADVQVDCTSVSITKSSTQQVDDALAPGDTFAYELEVANNGTLDVNNLDVFDPIPGQLVVDASGITIEGGSNSCALGSNNTVECEIPALDAGSAVTIHIPVAVPVVGEISIEQCTEIVNEAWISGEFGVDEPAMLPANITLPGGDDIYSDPVVNAIACETDLLLEKHGDLDTTAGDSDRVDAGDVISYTFTVTNTGDVPLYNVALTDDLVGIEWDGESTIAELQPGESNEVSLTARYEILQDDLDVGEVINCADASASTSNDITVEASSPDDDRCVTVALAQQPGVSIDKQGELEFGDNDRADVGDSIRYTFDVTNTGNVTLSEIEVTDLLPGLDWDGEHGAESLKPGVTITFSATYVVTMDDMVAGERSNIATVTAVPPQPMPVAFSMGFAFAAAQQLDAVSASDEVVITLAQVPEIELDVNDELDMGPDGRVGLGDVIVYTFTITNTGNVPLSNVTVDDPGPGLTWDSEPSVALLNPGETVTFAGSYALDQPDLDAGSVSNCFNLSVENDAVDAIEVCEETQVPYAPDATPGVTPGPTSISTPVGTTTPTAPVVDGLPQTGQGGVASVATVLWAASLVGLLALGGAACGFRWHRN